MQKSLAPIAVAFVIAGCAQTPKETIAPQPNLPTSRSEPVFYNGKTYQLNYVQNAEGYLVTVKGMSSKQQADAIAVASSSLRYFACKDSQVVQVLDKPTFNQSAWRLTAKCG